MKTQTSLSKILFPEEHISTAILKMLDDGIIETRRLLDEANTMYEQSKIELNNAIRRNSAVMAQIQKMQSDLDGIAKLDLQQAYSSALDSQQMMLVVRGQTDKLKSEIGILTDSVKLLETVSIMIRDAKDSSFGYEVKDSGAILQMVIDAQETERQRLSRQIHDGPAQVLSNLIIQAEITQKYFDLDQNVARQELSTLKSTVVNTFQMIRDYIYELRPMMLDDLGFFPTVKRYIETFKEQAGIEIHLTIHGKEKRLEQYLETMLFRTMQELLQNAYQY
ncbi:MAG: histidine kinase, partial [Anaerolineaceae bacterium]